MLIFTISIFMTFLTVGIHTLGVSAWLDVLTKRYNFHYKKKEFLHLFRGVLMTAMTLIMLHVFEALLWAVLYISLPAQAGLKSFHDALYLSMITITTLGYGDVTLNHEWQILTGVEGMVGIVVFGLTTATLFVVLQRSWQLGRHKSLITDDDE